ncbi:hypothetical protein UVI_02011250 [Ustilaginoidea virens]|uniref:Uncharacterized protein n=1 Tax=Ustilaginoidea virens TaxID=1159556 RepID=A0A1B5L2X5_USTVR|nr:hypothetical protein UVI_02011250 [Ustilaginoidea virens]
MIGYTNEPTIGWYAGQQDTVTTSSTEAELLAISHTTKEVIAFRRLCEEVGLHLVRDVPTVQCDNIQTIRLLKEEFFKLVTRLRHVDIHHHWSRQEVQKGAIDVTWVPTGVMIADGFTKPLTGRKFGIAVSWGLWY